ncbi:MAG: hypothetical protein M9921_13365 [Fimbriimonadaceae bacterium]|nr:hypothetical protein [Chthonomonadaceae bacterium]MCO5297835.1 hypothetical protein [Fimbriimonadaceae bacterium]
MRILRHLSIVGRLLLALIVATGTSLPVLGAMLCSTSVCGEACPMHARPKTSCCGEKAPSATDAKCRCTIRAAHDTVQVHYVAPSSFDAHPILALPSEVPALPTIAALAEAAPEIVPREQSPPSVGRSPDLGRAPPAA